MPAATAAATDLVAAIDRVVGVLARRLGQAGESRADADADGDRSASGEAAQPAGLARVTEAFGLNAFERDLLVLLAAVELDPRATPLIARALGGSPAPTFGLALACLDMPVWHAITPSAPLRAHRLVELGAGPLTAAPLAIDERVLHALCSVSTVDARLATRLHRLQPRDHHPPPSFAKAVAAVIAAGHAGLPFQVVGGSADDRLALVAACLTRDDAVPAWRALAAELPRTVEEHDAFARLWDREVRLTGARLAVDAGVDGTDPDPAAVATVTRLVDRLEGSVVVMAPTALVGGPDTVIGVPGISAADQRVLWRDGLADALPRAVARGLADELVERFDLGWQPIVRASALLAAELRLDQPAGGGDIPAAARLVTAGVSAVHAVTRPALEGLAEQITPTATRDRLVVPAAVDVALADIVRHVRHRRRVHDDWGFDGARGRGIAALFTGPSGTGKTLAGEVIASELGLQLWRVDLSVVVSKYIGETEKHLRSIFDAAEAGTVVLLFDEADALFGKRTDVRDSHDRYANQEVSYLLQRLETFRGVAILTTNLRAAIDDAFLRRFRFVVSFPFPDAEQRAAIWHAVVPAAAPFLPVDVSELARLGLTGGHLRNIAVAAAVLGAADGGVVTPEHLGRAVRSEYAKLGRTLTSAEDRALVATLRRAAPPASGSPEEGS